MNANDDKTYCSHCNRLSEECICVEATPRPAPLEGTFTPKVIQGNPNDPRHHPNVLRAADEIRAVLKKYDLAAMVTVQGPRSTAFVRVINPSWSCCHFEKVDDRVAVRFRSKLEDFPDLETQKKCTEETAGMLIGFHRQAERDMQVMESVLSQLSQHFEITSVDGPTRGN